MNSMKKNILLIILILAVAGIYGILNFEKKPLLGSATLSWNANSEPDLAGYKIYYGANPRTTDCPDGGYAKIIDAGKEANYKINNLESGKTYYFSITSYNSARKESCFSKEMQKTIKLSPLERIKSFFSK